MWNKMAANRLTEKVYPFLFLFWVRAGVSVCACQELIKNVEEVYFFLTILYTVSEQ